MHVYLSKLTYEYDDEGKIKDAIIGLNGMDQDKQFTDSQLLIKPEDLGEEATFDTVTNARLIEVARKKLIEYIQGSGQNG